MSLLCFECILLIYLNLWSHKTDFQDMKVPISMKSAFWDISAVALWGEFVYSSFIWDLMFAIYFNCQIMTMNYLSIFNSSFVCWGIACLPAVFSSNNNPGPFPIPSNPRPRALPLHPTRLGKHLHFENRTPRLLAPSRARRNAHGQQLVPRLHVRPPLPRPVGSLLCFRTCQRSLPTRKHTTSTRNRRREAVLGHDGWG